MKIVTVKVQSDHLELISKGKKPILAITELIWNGFDADADKVSVSFTENKLNFIDSIRVTDNGHGIPLGDTEEAFGNLGGSWKKKKKITKKGRLLHGRYGKGRFRAFALGGFVEWDTRYRANGNVMTYKIKGKREEPLVFNIEDENRCNKKTTGTEVQITEIVKNFRLRNENAIAEITEQFALYLSEYPNIRITYDGKHIDSSEVKKLTKEFSLDGIELQDGSEIKVQLVIIEWEISRDERRLFLCGEDGFTYEDMPPGIHAPSFNFTAYIKSDLIKQWAEDGSLGLVELHPKLKSILDATRDKLRDYFRDRSLEEAGKVVEQWKKEDIYPYEGRPKDILETTERQVFDICALNLNRYLPKFDESPARSKRVSLSLLRHAIETSPSAVRKIFSEVLELPEEKQKELAEILETTSLSSLMNLAHTITNRFQFINGLEQIVGDRTVNKCILERSHLQHIIEAELWIFGEHYGFCSPRGGDITLENVLKAHLSIMGREELAPFVETRELRDIPDLCLYQQYIYGKQDEYENLVIELKRPKDPLNEKHLSQIKRYAREVANDPAFDKEKTRWTFYLISTNYNEAVEVECNQRDRSYGHVLPAKNYDVWVKRWGDIIQEAKGRLEFVRKQMNYNVQSNEEGLAYLRKKHEEYLPEEILSGSSG